LRVNHFEFPRYFSLASYRFSSVKSTQGLERTETSSIRVILCDTQNFIAIQPPHPPGNFMVFSSDFESFRLGRKCET
jgi:hypothetical protein